jgi:hypothetical protein
MVIWYNVLFAINKVGKKLQSQVMYIDSTLDLIQGMMEYFEAYNIEMRDFLIVSILSKVSYLII